MSGSHFNGLTPAEAERLALLAEECAEVVVAVGKVLRHGYESRDPRGGPTNRRALENELGDVLAAVSLSTVAKDIDDRRMSAARLRKLRRVERYLHHNAYHVVCLLGTE